MLNWIQNRRKYLSFFIGSLVIIVITGIISPIISNSITKDKEIYFKEKISELEKSTQELISKTELRLSNKLNEIIDITKINSSSDSLSKKKLFEFVANKEFDNIGVGIYNDIGELIIWNNYHPFSENQFKNLLVTTNNESGFFYNSSLKVYLTLLSSVDKHTILLSIPIEKKYKLRNEYFDPLSLKNDMSIEYNVDLEIVYQNNIASENQESQKFSFDIKNNLERKIGYAYIKNINIDENIENYENVIVIVQSFFTLLAFIFLGLWLFSSLKQYKYKSIQIAFTFLYILFFRVITFLLDIPDKLGLTELNNPIYFSSTFGFGIVKSPIELFLTIISLVIILIYVFKFIVLKEIWKESKRNIPFAVGQILVIIILYFFVLRIFGSVINSIVFDSTILYFKETLLFSDLHLCI